MTDNPETGLAPISVEQQAEVLEQVIMHGDLARLTPPQRIAYYRQVCDTLGLNPFTKPFQYISLNGKLTLYPSRDATDQLRRIHGISVDSMERSSDQERGIHTVVARGHDRHGRTDEALGAVFVENLRGENLANALMKAETKAKRRLTLSLAGLGMFDESELGGIDSSIPVTIDENGNIIAGHGEQEQEPRTVTEAIAAKLSAVKAAREAAPAEPEVVEEVPTPQELGITVAELAAETGMDEEDAAAALEVAPGQEQLFDTLPEPEPEAVSEPPDEPTPAARSGPPGGVWTGLMVGEPAEDILTPEDEGVGYEEPTGSEGLRLRVQLDQGLALVALHGSALDDYYKIDPEPGDGTKLKVAGILRLVPWNKAGVAQPPYRRILARKLEAV